MAERQTMRTARLVLLGGALALAACRSGGDGAGEAPRPLSVTPDHGPVSAPVDVLIRGDFHARVTTDFTGSSDTGVDARFTALLGQVPLDGVSLQADGALAATVPPGLATGSYDLTVIDPQGRSGTLAGAYRVDPDGAGTPVASFRIDPLGPQQAMTPFAVAITALDAQGRAVADFNGSVQLADLTGTAVPGSAGLFVNGQWAGLVEIRTSHPADVLTASDGLGHSGRSAPFLVSPSPAAGLRFLTPARTGQAGACSGASQPLTVGLFDAFGAPTQAAVDLPLAVAATPAAGFEVFADAGCAVPAAPVVAAGASSTTFWFLGTLAGTVSLTASAPSLQADSQPETVVAAAPAAIAFVTTAQTVNAGVCSQAVTVEVQDAFGNPSPPGGVALDLAASAGSFGLFSDSACSVAATAVTVAPGATQGSFWFSGTTAQLVTVTAGSAALGLASASQDEIVLSQGSATRLVFLTPPQSVSAGSCSDQVTIQAQDSFGNAVEGAGAQQVTLSASPAAGMAFFSDPACSVAASVIQIGAGLSTTGFWFRGTVAGAVAITAGSSTLTDAVQTETVAPGPPARLDFTSAPMTVAAGACSGLATVTVHDAFGNAAPAASALPVALAAAPSTGVTFFADALCATPTTQVAVPAGASAATFAFKATQAGTETVTASAAGLTPASQDETIRAATPDHLVITSVPQAVVAGVCSGAVAVQARDPSDNPAPVPTATQVALSAVPVAGFRFFADAACATPVTSATIAAGQTGTTFFFSGTAAGSVAVTATAAGWTPATQSETIGPAAADHLVYLTAPQSVTAGACSGAATVESRDAWENPAPLAGGAAVGLAASPAAGLSFYAGAGCAGAPVSSLAIAPGASSATFSFLDTAAGSVAVTASSAPLNPATQTETVNPAAPGRLAFTTTPQTRQAGVCSAAVTVQSQDAYGNVSTVSSATTVALSASPATGFAFYSDSGCSASTTTAGIGAGSSTASFWFKGTAPGTVTVTAAVAGWSPSPAQGETITVAAPDHLVFTTTSQTRQAGACSAAVTVQSQDQYGNVSAVSADTAVALSASPGTGFTFYSNSGCTTSTTSVNIGAGSSTASFWFKGTAAGTVTVTASALGMSPSPTQPEIVNPAAPDRIAFASAPQTVTAGQCSAPVTLESRDPYGNPSAVAAATAVALTAVPATGFAFYSDSGCGTSIGSVTVAAGSSTAGFWFRGTAAGSVTVTATPAGLSAANQAETVAAAATPSQLVFLTAPQTAIAGTCSGKLTVQTQDSFGNPQAPAGGATVSLSAAPSAGLQFYAGTDPTCAGAAVAAVSIPSGNNAADFYFSGTAAGSVAITASSAPLNPATQTETVNAAAAARLAFTTTPQTRQAGVCSAAATVQSQDAFGNVSAVAVATAVALSASPATGFTFYSDSGCGTSTTSVIIGAGSSTASFWFKGTAPGTVTVTAAVSGWSPRTQDETITVAAPDHLVFTTGAQTVNAGACSGIATVQSRDAYGNVSAVSTSTAVALSASPATGFTFYSDSGCSAATTSVNIGAGSSTASFWFKGLAPGTVTVTASVTGWSPSPTQDQTISPSGPDHLVFLTAPQTKQAGACSSAVTVQSLDQYGNASGVLLATTVNLSASPATGFTLYSDSGCSASANSVTIATGSSTVSFWFKGTAPGTVTVTASVAGWSPSPTQDQTITPAPASKLVFTTAPQTVTAGTCSPAATVESQDAYGNVSPVSASTTVALSAAPGGGFAFYADPACGTAATSVTIPAAGTTATFYFRGTVARNVTVTAAAAGMSPSPTQVETVAPAAPTSLAFTSAAQAVTAGACSAPATLQSLDAYGNVSPVSAATAVDLAAAPSTGFTFYSDSGCSVPTTSVTIAAGSSTTSLRFKGTTVGSVTVTASVVGWTVSATQVETVGPGTPDHFAWDAIPSPQGQSIPFGVTVRAVDLYGNATPSFTGTATLSIAPSLPLTCTSGCTSGLTTGAFAAGVWTGGVNVGAAAAAVTLTATSGAVAGTSAPFLVQTAANPSPPMARFTASPVVIREGQTVTFDASASSDYEDPTSLLQVSWDFPGTSTGTPTYPTAAAPWTAWTTTKTAANTYPTFGTYMVRLAVVDTAGTIGYATTTVVVLTAGATLCTVTTAADLDDGATSCGGPNYGTDGKLSLREALEVAPAGATITFSGPMTITGSGSYSVPNAVSIVAPAGVILDTKTLAFSATVLVSGLEITRQPAGSPISVDNTGAVTLRDVSLHDSAGVSVKGILTLERTRVAACTRDCITQAVGGATINVRWSEFRDTPSFAGVNVATCSANPRILLDAYANAFTRTKTGILLGCPGNMRVQNNTFAANGTGVAYQNAGLSQVLRNNIFSGQTTAAVDCGVTTPAHFVNRDYHLLYGNASDGCIAADPNTLAADPLYIFQAASDYRLLPTSPALDSAFDVGLYLVPAFPAAPGPRYLGAGPDRGGRETF